MSLRNFPMIKWLPLTLTRKLILYVLLTGVFPLVLLGWISYSLSDSALRAEAHQFTQELMAEKKATLNLLMEGVESLIANLTSIDDIKQVLDPALPSSSSGDYGRLSTQAKIGYILSGYTNIRGLLSIDLFSLKGDHYHVGETLNVGEVSQAMKDRFLDLALRSELPVVWTGIEENINVNSKYRKVITAVKAIRALDQRTLQERPVGLLVVAYNPEVFCQIFHRRTHNGQTFMVLDQEGRIVYHPDLSQVGTRPAPGLFDRMMGAKGAFFDKTGSQPSGFVYDRSNRSGWALVSFIPVDQLRARIADIRKSTLLALGGSLLLVLLFSLYISKCMVGPIGEITQLFKKTGSGTFDLGLRLRVGSRDEIGELVRWFNTFLEGLEVKERMEKELLQSREQYRSLVNRISEALFEIDREGRFSFLNTAWTRITGFMVEESLGTSAFRYFRPEAQEEIKARFGQLMQKDPPRSRQAELVRKDGGTCWIELQPSLTFDAEGNPTGLSGMVIDITERKKAEDDLHASHELLERRVEERTAELVTANEALRAEIAERERAETEKTQLQEQLRQSQKMEAVGQLAGGVAHDFNNLLTVINGYAEILLTDQNGSESHREEIEEIRHAGERASSLTRQLLAFSRKQVLQPRLVELNQVMTNLEKMLRRLIGEDIRLVTQPADGLAPIRIDPGQMEQVLLNLVVNARDAMPTGGTVTIATRNLGHDEGCGGAGSGVPSCREVLISVTDTGTGMAPEVKERIFEPFFTTKEHGKGTGLGLSTVYGIVSQSGGAIRVISEPGQGSTFEISFPAAADQPDECWQDEVSLSSPCRTETILLVEDEERVRRLARLVLQKSGCTVLEAAGGEEALKLLMGNADRPIDLMITDIVMPGINGCALAEEVTRIRPGLRVLYMSGYVDHALFRQGILEPGVAFLQKPFTPETLRQKVFSVLEPG
jgi:PAS domain S-box-containing protein